MIYKKDNTYMYKPCFCGGEGGAGTAGVKSSNIYLYKCMYTCHTHAV